jgi:hypothetical protein
MALIDDVKAALRISTTNSGIVGEVNDLIDAAQSDLKNSGILAEDTTDPLIKRAIVLYAKANFGYNNPDADRLRQSYEMLKASLGLSGDYVV